VRKPIKIKLNWNGFGTFCQQGRRSTNNFDNQQYLALLKLQITTKTRRLYEYARQFATKFAFPMPSAGLGIRVSDKGFGYCWLSKVVVRTTPLLAKTVPNPFQIEFYFDWFPPSQTRSD